MSRLYETIASGGFDWRKKHGEPATPVQLFECICWEQFFNLTPINLLYMLSFLPLLVWSSLYLREALLLFQEGTTEEAVQYMNAYVLGLIPALGFTGPFRAAMARVMRYWAAERFTGTLKAYGLGLKENWKQGLLAGVLQGLLPAVAWYGFVGVMVMGTTGLFTLIYALTTLMILLFLLSLQLLYPQLAVYDLPFKAQLKNSLRLTLLQLGRCLLVRAGVWFIFLVYIASALLVPSTATQMLLLPVVYYALFGGTVTQLALAVFNSWLREKYMEKA